MPGHNLKVEGQHPFIPRCVFWVQTEEDWFSEVRNSQKIWRRVEKLILNLSHQLIYSVACECQESFVRLIEGEELFFHVTDALNQNALVFALRTRHEKAMLLGCQFVAPDPIFCIVKKEELVPADNVAHKPAVSSFRANVGSLTIQRNEHNVRAIGRSLNADAELVFVDDQFCRRLS